MSVPRLLQNANVVVIPAKAGNQQLDPRFREDDNNGEMRNFIGTGYIPKYFSKYVCQWHAAYGRKTLPWQINPTPYRVWISEIMLQQTQVNTVIPYFERFMAQFPDIASLAAASDDSVYQLWAGLGYYARARNLHLAARRMMQFYDGEMPNTVDTLMELPGIGRSTAGAIVSLSMKQSAPILDGNVKRVLARVFAITEWTGAPALQKQLWELSTTLTPQKQTAIYNQAMMDLGSLICTRTQPACHQCPVSDLCQAYQQNLQTQLPIAKPKKILPQREGTLILLSDPQGRILLEKRPTPGIWGGLWCFPECPDRQQLPAWMDACTLEWQPQEQFTTQHTFTHYRWHLTIRAAVIQDAQALTQRVSASQTLYWHHIHSSRDKGLAAPVNFYYDRIIKI